MRFQKSQKPVELSPWRAGGQLGADKEAALFFESSISGAIGHENLAQDTAGGQQHVRMDRQGQGVRHQHSLIWILS